MKLNNKLNLILVAFVLLFVCLTANGANAQVNAGGGLAYGTNVEKLGLHINGFYTIPANEQIRAGLEYTYFFPENYTGGSTRFSEFNINAHYLFYDEEELAAYGLAGINHATSSVNWDDSFFGAGGTSGSWTGLNIGAGAQYNVGFGSLYGELKFVISTVDQLVLSVGTRIPFDF